MGRYVVDIDVLAAIADGVVLVVGGMLTLLAIRAARRTDTPRLRLFALGFGVITVGAIAELGLTGLGNPALGSFLRSVITAIGFGLVAYSLYVTDRTDRSRQSGGVGGV